MSCEVLPSNMQFWANIYSLEIPSNERLLAIRSLLSCPTNITVARNLQGDEAQKLIDLLDQALVRLRLDNKLWKRCLRLLSKISKAHGIIPASYLLQRELIHVGRVRCHGGSADVSDGEYLGGIVAIKRLKLNGGDLNRIFRRLCREIICWKHLSHPNILPLLGVSMSMDPPYVHILSEWMPNGNVVEYARSNPEANRLQLLSGVMAGVVYLHSLNVVHGDLKGANILVDDAGIARVADFGFMTLADLSANLLSISTVSSGGTFCWMSPELLDPSRFSSSGLPTPESDCYALGMVIYEVLTGLQPFHRLHGYTPVSAILRGERPGKPPGAESLGFSHTLWELVQLCWSESTSTRPTARELLDCICPVSLTWNPPPTYPAPGTDEEHISESNSSGSLATPLSECEL